MSGDRLVVVGASLAGLRAVEAARRLGHRGTVTMIGAERHLPYDRPPLSKQVLTGRIDPADTALEAAPELDIRWLLGAAATGVDLDARTVAVAGGERVPYDLLVVATGAHARALPHLGRHAGVHLLRTLDDAAALRADLGPGRRLVVIGAGFLGLEVASSAVAVGAEVTVVESQLLPLSRVLGPDVGALVAEWHREHGVDLRLGTEVTRLQTSSTGQVTAAVVRGPDGAEVSVAADVIVVAVGAAPSTDWLTGSGVDLDDGVRTDSALRVLADGRPLQGVVAAGDVVRRDDPTAGRVRFEHWTSAAEQGPTAATTLLGVEAPPVVQVPYLWSDQYDRKLQMVGTLRPGDEAKLLDGSFESRRFVTAYGRRGRLVAAIGFSRPARVMALQRAIAAGDKWPPA